MATMIAALLMRSRMAPRILRGTLPAWCVLAISLCGTALAGYFAQFATVRDAHSRFEREIGVVQIDLSDRLRAYEQILRAGASAFQSWPSVTRQNWRHFVANLHITENYPGIQGLGFAQVVPAAEREAYLQQVRNEGFPYYRIWPEGERAIYTAIVYLEPFDWRNQRAFGYDMFTEPVRRAAMEHARDSGLASISGKVKLVQETDEDVQAGFLMYLPVYRTVSPANMESRRRALIGYVYSPFRMDDFMHGLLVKKNHHVGLEIFDGQAPSADTLLYSSLSPDELHAYEETSFVETVSFNVNGRAWTLRFSALPSLKVDGREPIIVVVGGAFASLLLSTIAWSLAKNRTQAAEANKRLQLDIARREQIEARLREKETSFRYLFEKNPNPMWVYDRSTLSILEVNDTAVSHYGYSHDEFRRMRITDLRPAEDVPELVSYVQNRSSGLKGSGEWRHNTKDGRRIDVEITSYTLDFEQRAAVLVVARDITESKRAEEALREAEAVARGVLDTALDAYVRMDQDGRITGWNVIAENTFGWARSEAIGRTVADTIIPPDQRGAHQRGLARFLTTGDGPLLNRRIELQALHRSGVEFPIEAAITATNTDRGRVFSAFIRDLREKRQAEEQLRQAQKMEAVGQLTGGIAHDFNNLLTVIIGNLELTGVRSATDAQLVDLINRALTAAEKGAALTHRLLAFSRQQALNPTPTNLNPMVADMIDLLRRTLGEHVEIEIRLSEELWSALADKSEVENALLNLAVNSRDAMPDGGKLTVETGNVTLDAEYATRNAEVEPGDYVMLAVTDTGTGMPPEIVEHAFEPFFTTKGIGKGTGLGLSMIYGFAKQSGGHLKIYSEVGHGTTVRLYLPRATNVQSAISAPPTRSEDQAGSETVLVVEDDEAVRELVVTQLQDLGYRVLEAPDGSRALTLLRGAGIIDLLFTDVVMPGGMTGQQLAEEGRQLRPEMKVLLTSGYTQNSIVHQGKLDKGVHLLSKPYRRDDLAHRIREVLDSRTGLGATS
jgi:PAS domain S-box-containing protein